MSKTTNEKKAARWVAMAHKSAADRTSWRVWTFINEQTRKAFVSYELLAIFAQQELLQPDTAKVMALAAEMVLQLDLEDPVVSLDIRIPPKPRVSRPGRAARSE